MLERRIAVLAIFASFLGANSQEAVEVTCHVNGKKSIQCVSEKFLSISIDPAVLLAGVNLSESSLLLAQHLSPAYIRIAGPSTKFIRYFDEGVLLPTDTNSVPVTPATWFAVNEWLRLAGLQPVYGVNDVDELKGLWDPRGALSLFELSDKLNVTAYWQLGFDSSNKSELKYKQDLDLFRSVLDGFPDKNEIWKIVGSDISLLPKPESTIAELKNIVDAAMWEPREITETTFPEKDGASKIIQNQKLAKTGVKVWTCVPKASSHITFASALMFAEQLGQAAKIGYDVVFRQPRMYELFASTPVFWLSALHKKLMGTNVLEAKTSTSQPGVDVFAHCSRNQNSFIRRGALTLMTVNRNSEEVMFKVKFGVTQADKTMEVQYYILTAPSLNSSDTFLNDNLLTPEILAEKDPFKPKLRRAKTPSFIALTVPPRSIAFFVLPGAKVPVCVEDEVETNMLLEEIEEDQKALLSEEIALKLGPRGSFGGNLVLEEITKQIKKEMESDERYYKDKFTGRMVEPENESKIEAKEDEGLVNRRRKYFIDRAKLSEKRRKTPSFEKKKDDFKKFLLEKSKTAKLEDKATPKSTQMDLTSDEVEKILRSRAKARASQRNIVFTDTELNALVHKAKKRFYSDKSRRRRSTNELEGIKIKRGLENTNQIVLSRMVHPYNDIQYVKSEGKLKSNRIKIPLRNKRDINQLMFHRVTNADNLIQNKEKRDEAKQTRRKLPKSKRDIEKKRLGVELRKAEKKHKIRVKKQELKGRINEKKGRSRNKRDVSLYARMHNNLKQDKVALKEKLEQKLNDVKRSKRGTERLAEARQKVRARTQALKDRMKETLNNIRRTKRDVDAEGEATTKGSADRLAETREKMRVRQQEVRERMDKMRESMRERLSSLRRSRRDINMDMVNEHGKKKSKKQKIVKEATMRIPGKTSAEVLADIEAEEKESDMEEPPPPVKTEIFAEMAKEEDEEEEDSMFDLTPGRKDPGLFKKRKKGESDKPRKHQPKTEDLQFLRASEEFTDIEDDYPCIHEFFMGKQATTPAPKKTIMELGEYTAQKIKAGRKQKPGLWEEAAGFRRKRKIPDYDDLSVEPLEVPKDLERHQDDQPKSSERAGPPERHITKREIITKRSSEETNFQTRYGMPKSEIARHLSHLNRIMSFNKSPDILKRRSREPENKEQQAQTFPLVEVEEKNRRGMLKQLDKLRKKIQRRKNDIDKLLAREAKKYGEIFPAEAERLGNSLLSQFSRDLGKELSITKDLIRTQIPLEQKMKEYSYKLKEIADRNAKLGALLTRGSYPKPPSSSEEIDGARSRATSEDQITKQIESEDQSMHHSEETDVGNVSENPKPKETQENNRKVSLILTRTGAILQADHEPPSEIKQPTFNSRIGVVEEDKVLHEGQENQKKKEITMKPPEETNISSDMKEGQKSNIQLDLDHPALAARMESDEREKEIVKDVENMQTPVEPRKQEESVRTQKRHSHLELEHPMFISRMDDISDEERLKGPENERVTSGERQKNNLLLPTEQIEEGFAHTPEPKLSESFPQIVGQKLDHLTREELEKHDLMFPTEQIEEEGLAYTQKPKAVPKEGKSLLLGAQEEVPAIPSGDSVTFGQHVMGRETENSQDHQEVAPLAPGAPFFEFGDHFFIPPNEESEAPEKPEQMLPNGEHPVADLGQHDQALFPQTVLDPSMPEFEQTHPIFFSRMGETSSENENTKAQSQDNTLRKEQGTLQSPLEESQQQYIHKIENQLNEQLETLLARHNERLETDVTLEHPKDTIKENPEETVTTIVHQMEAQHASATDENLVETSSKETDLVRSSSENDSDDLGELMENEKVPTTLKPPRVEKTPEEVDEEKSAEYIVHNILSQMPQETENSGTDIFKKFIEAMKDQKEIDPEVQENDKLLSVTRKKRYIIGDKRFGNYRPLTKNLKKWKPSDIMKFKNNATSFKTLKRPPNDYHIFKTALEHNKVKVIRRSVNDIENHIDQSGFNKGMFDKKVRDIFKPSKKFQNKDKETNMIVKMKFGESDENDKKNEISTTNKYEEFLKNTEGLTKDIKDAMRNQIDIVEDEDDKTGHENGIGLLQVNNNKDSVENIQKIEKNKAKTKLFERVVSNISGFLTNIGKQVGMYVKQINI
ncbi:unnamed protein product [Acanthoscelides obtectus]|uniref:Heparanase n=1 Tax=Acanthoscelides obtectus TaxID=200917 RepID=A0A9P0L9R2_ACAOB|nr:unnamed protein product [Acanthoscelides obtectus]CAK1626560.1 Heparanase [Acanthoscelides obtectus]